MPTQFPERLTELKRNYIHDETNIPGSFDESQVDELQKCSKIFGQILDSVWGRLAGLENTSFLANSDNTNVS